MTSAAPETRSATAYVAKKTERGAKPAVKSENGETPAEERKATGGIQAMRLRLLQQEDEDGMIPDNALLNAVEQKNVMPVDPAIWPSAHQDKDELSTQSQRSDWTWLGPGNIGGRIRSIVIDPTNPNIIYAGSATGGIWKTTNGGQSWFPLNDFLTSISVSSIVIDPTNPNVLYVGTGEQFSTNYGNDLFANATRGAGIFKTTNGGASWTQLPSTASPEFYIVNRLAISPANSQVLLAATHSGIWRSTNGGTSWSQRTSNNEMDVEFHPTNGNLCIVSTFGLTGYSVDGGQSWFPATGIAQTQGVIELKYSRSNPAIVYASVNEAQGQVYLSLDGGGSYGLVNQGVNYLANQGDYDNVLWVDPVFENIIIVGGIDLYLSSDYGRTLFKISRWQAAPSSPHADQHAIVSHPGFNGGNNRTIFFGNDGGVYKASDIAFVTETSGWTELNNNLGITQFYSGAGNAATGTVVGGTQDNGSLRFTTSGGTEGWNEWSGGDGGYSAADPTDARYFYGEYVYLDLARSTNGGASSEPISGRFPDFSGWKSPPYVITDARDSFINQPAANFIAPFVLDPNNVSRILAGGRSLWRTNDAKTANTFSTGPQWAVIKPPAGFSQSNNISAIAIAPGNSNIVWVGHNNGDVFFTTNGLSATPSWFRADLSTPNLPNRFCLRITIDPANSSRVYVTFGGFNTGNVWRTDNGGSTWTNISVGLPAVPVRSLIVSPQNSNRIYIGTEIGVFASADGGVNWSPTSDGPTNCAVDELFILGNQLIAATHGRGMWKTNLDPPTVRATYVSQSGDFDGDSRDDIAVWRASAGAWFIVNSASNTVRVQGWGGPEDVPVASDYDGDRRADIAVWRPSAGAWFIINSSNNTVRAQGWGGPGDIPVPADYDGDGRTDLAVWRPDSGAWFIINSSTNTVRVQGWGTNTLGDVPVPGDYDGDGKADIAVWRPSAGAWFIINSASNTVRAQGWGGAGDIPVPGDYDNDKRTDLAVWRPSAGAWFIINSSTNTARVQGWGGPGDTPVPGDYDADGRDDLSVWRGASGAWFIISSGTNTARAVGWGSEGAGDVPVSTMLIRR